MDFSSIIYAAIGAGLGGLIGAIILIILGTAGKSKNLQAIIPTVLVIAGYTTSAALYKNMTLPRFFPGDLEALEETSPVLKYIRAEDPETYAELIYPLDQMARNNRITQDGLTEYRTNFDAILAKKRKTAPVAILRLENEIASEQYQILKEKLPVTCTQKFYGRPYAQLDKIVGTTYQEKENAALAKYFTEPSRSSDYTPSAERGKINFDKLVQDLIASIKIEDLDPVISDEINNRLDHQKICDFSSAFSLEINSLSDEEILDIYRYLENL